MGINWANLVEQGRAKAFGVSWSDEEQNALRELKIPADYVRNGCLTLEAYEQAKTNPKKPLTYLSKKEAQGVARDLGIVFTEETTRPELLELINLKNKEKSNAASSF